MTDAQNLAVTTWEGYIGQETLKERLTIHIRAAVLENRPLEHVLLTGPFGSGKSTMARLISKQLAGSDGTPEPILELTMPMDRRSLIRALDHFSGGIVFLDEIHALARKDQEMLLPLLTEGYVQDTQGGRHSIPWLTVIAATTERDKVIKTLYSRFQIAPEHSPYTDDELGAIVQTMAQMIHVPLTGETAVELGRAAGGIPRNAEHLVLAARALMANRRNIDTDSILELCGLDRDGMNELQMRELRLLDSQGGRAGERTISMMLRLPPDAVRDLERLPLERGYLIYTPGGRELTAKGRQKCRGCEVEAYQRR